LATASIELKAEKSTIADAEKSTATSAGSAAGEKAFAKGCARCDRYSLSCKGRRC
jgi:hypothetical protein